MTLAEVMIFLMLASVAVLGLVSAQIYAVHTSAGNEDHHLATTLLNSLMSEILERQREDFSHNCASARATCGDDPRYQAAVAQVYTDASQTLKRISVSVYWSEHELSLWTYVYKN